MNKFFEPLERLKPQLYQELELLRVILLQLLKDGELKATLLGHALSLAKLKMQRRESGHGGLVFKLLPRKKLKSAFTPLRIREKEVRLIIFKAKSIEKFLRAFIESSKNEIPQYELQVELGSGTFYDAYRHLEDLGLVQRGVCYDPRKKKEVTCVKLTEKGKKIANLLRAMYQLLENTGSEARSSSSSSS